MTLGSKSNARGSPTRRTSTLSSAHRPTGTDACGTLGIVNSSARALVFERLKRGVFLLHQLPACAVRFDEGADVLAGLLAPGDLLGGGVLLSLERLDFEDQGAATLVERRPGARE